MAKKKEEKASAVESAEVLQDKLVGVEHWAEENPKIVLGIVAFLILAVGGYFGFNYWKGQRNDEGQKEMFQAIRYFESDSLNLALNGDGNNLGFLQIIDDYSMTDAANLANFYTGAIYLKQGKFPLAVFHLEDFSASDLLVQARAYSLIGDAYMEQDKFDQAASYYSKAANYKPTKEFTPMYLMKAAVAYEKLDKKDKALDAYRTIVEKFWDSSEAASAKKEKARLESNS
jgi:predicted negative regulator of RcsB-dependent stress response